MTSSSTNIAPVYTHSTIPIFNEEFYDCWSDKMGTFLRFQDLWDFVKNRQNPTTSAADKDTAVREDKRRDALALHFIQQGVATPIYPRIMGSKTAKEA